MTKDKQPKTIEDAIKIIENIAKVLKTMADEQEQISEAPKPKEQKESYGH